MKKTTTEMTKEYQDETMKLCIKAYDKGINDAFDVLKQGFISLKERGLDPKFDIDTVMLIIETCREGGNKIPTTYDTTGEPPK